MKRTVITLLTVAITMIACKSAEHSDLGDGVFANIQTNKGNVIVRLEHEKTPVTVANFISLAEGTSPFVNNEFKDKKYYDGLTFHRVMKDFMIQGGDPTGTGTGSPGYRFIDEFDAALKHSKPGILSMANSGPKTNGSQFFITHKATPWLDGKHTVFGEVVEGMHFVDSIANVPVAGQNKPVEEIRMNTVSIIRNGTEAKRFDALEIMTDYFAEEGVREKEEQKKKEELAAKLIDVKANFVTETSKQKAVAETLPSGLQIYSVVKGSGEKPQIGNKVGILYAGYFEDGNLFDSNIESVANIYGTFNENRKAQQGYAPIPMDYSTDSQLIAGFREGILNMKVGDKVRLFIPSHLGYGPQGRNPIPPNTNLIFDLEMTSIIK